LSPFRNRCSYTAKVQILEAISRFSLQVFVPPFVFPKFQQELASVALPQLEKPKNGVLKKLSISVGARGVVVRFVNRI